MHRQLLVAAACAACLAAACVEQVSPSVTYTGVTTRPKAVAQMAEFRLTPPDRPYRDLGTVSVLCPTQDEVILFSGIGSVTQHGGCNYLQARNMALLKASQAGADGIYGITTGTAANGAIGNLTASAFVYSSPATIR